MTKVIKTLNPVTIMKRLSKMLEQSIQDSDDDYFYDRLYFMKKTFEHYSDEYLSNDVKDKVRVIDSGTKTQREHKQSTRAQPNERAWGQACTRAHTHTYRPVHTETQANDDSELINNILQQDIIRYQLT